MNKSKKTYNLLLFIRMKQFLKSTFIFFFNYGDQVLKMTAKLMEKLRKNSMREKQYEKTV